MKKSRELGMQTFDQALFDLYEAGRISYEDALRFADSTNEVRLNIKLHGKEVEGQGPHQGHRAPGHRLRRECCTAERAHKRPFCFLVVPKSNSGPQAHGLPFQAEERGGYGLQTDC